ncbi:MAG: 6-carboxytetrahydropterin synthase [Actinobacteria bacterium]|nr:6-carboxytetrahydropterin synthase [Actinomycetota bacterium]
MGASADSPRVAVYRHEHFNAAHRIHNPAMSDADNARIYGKCNNPNYHGHNYELSSQIKRHVLDQLDHKNLNLDVPQFKNVNPTAENIAVVVHGMLRPHVPSHLDLHVILAETPRNIVQYPADIVARP